MLGPRIDARIIGLRVAARLRRIEVARRERGAAREGSHDRITGWLTSGRPRVGLGWPLAARCRLVVVLDYVVVIRVVGPKPQVIHGALPQRHTSLLSRVGPYCNRLLTLWTPSGRRALAEQ